MRLVESMLWMLVMLVVAAIVVTKVNQAISELTSLPRAERHEVIDGERVAFWTTEHRGEPVRIYICPGQAPRVALAHEAINCEVES